MGLGNVSAGGDRDVFTATYFGDPVRRPAAVQFGQLDSHLHQPPSFPACAQFDSGPSGLGLVIDGDGHYQQVIGVTLAPPCPTVLYRALSRVP